uniref:At5g54075 n=1 Tax=Arabidopsis thaliana TaxID=3702 RepID=Q6ICW5_ARATH|nr:At5g54075 [Arabidopsis thaliana]AAT70480.1 At5g54075 [Arabidopsis thaliana]
MATKHHWSRPYLNRICSIGSYLCFLDFSRDRPLTLVDEP